MRAFLETANAGSFSGAARKLGMTQPTLSRQVAALEQDLGVTVFERNNQALLLTEAGTRLLEYARTMGEAAQEFSLAALGQSQDVEGPVTISASDAVAAWVLPPIVKQIRDAAPGIRLEIVTDNALSDLRQREADIAIRHVNPTEPDLIGRLLFQSTAGFYASQEWVARHGLPRTAQHVQAQHIIGLDGQGRFLSQLNALGFAFDLGEFRLLSENFVTNWMLVQQGLGLAVMIDLIGQRTPGVVRVLNDVGPLRFPLWLVTHRELRTARRIRVVFDLLAQELTALAPTECL